MHEHYRSRRLGASHDASLFTLFVFLNPSAFNYYLLLIAGSLPQCALNPVFTADGLPSPSLVLPKVSS